MEENIIQLKKETYGVDGKETYIDKQLKEKITGRWVI